MAPTRKNQSNYKRYAVYVLVALLLIGGCLLALEKTGVTDFYSRTTKSPGTSSINGVAPPNTVDYTSPANNDPDPSISTEKNPTQTPPLPVSDNSLSVTITRAGQDAAKGLAAVAAIGGTTSGTCTLELSKGGVIALQKSEPVKQESGLYVCYDFYTSKSALPAAGTYTLKLSVADGSKQGSASQSITIE